MNMHLQTILMVFILMVIIVKSLPLIHPDTTQLRQRVHWIHLLSGRGDGREMGYHLVMTNSNSHGKIHQCWTHAINR